MTPKNPPEPSKPFFFILAGLLILCFVIGGYWFYRHEATGIEARKYDELKAVADLKIQQIVAWRQERETDARIHSTGAIRTELLEWLKAPVDDSPIKTGLQNRLQTLKKYQGYEDLILAGTDGRVLLTLDPETQLEPEIQPLVLQAVSSNHLVFGDFFQCSHKKRIHLDVAAPIPGEDGLPAAVLVLRTDPLQYLYPLIHSWPMPSKTAETLLVRKDGDHVLFLNTLRHQSSQPLTIRIPLSRMDVPAIQAVLGFTGIFRGHDYRGADVLADIRAVPGSTWFMVSKVDTDELLAEIRYHGIIIGILTLMLGVIAGTTAGYIYKHQGKRVFQALYRSEQSRRKAEAEFKTTLYSIGDAVITADVSGKIRQMNPVAESLTGWTESDAKGRPAEDVFRIISEATNEKVENPVQKVLKNGLVVGLANHTLLIAKDGKQIPIADSGAPIRDESNAISGVVLVFRDQTREREMEQLLRARLNLLAESEARFRLFYEHSPVAYHSLDAEGKILDVNDTWLAELGYAKEEVIGKWFGDFLAGNDPDLFPGRFGAFKSAGEAHGVEFEMQKKDGDIINVAFEGRIGRDARNAFARTHCVFVNITERKRMEEALRSEKRFSDTMIQSLPGIFYLFDEAGHFLRWNKNFEAVSGYSSEEMEKIHPLDLFSGEGKKRVGAAIQEVFAKGQSHVEADFISKDGGKTPHYFTCLTFTSNNRTYLIGMGIDISERRRAEAELHSLSSHQQSLLSAIPDIVMEVDTNKVYTWANQPGYDFFGKDVIGKKADFYFEGEQPVYDMVQPLFNGNESIIYLESWQRRKDGQKRLLAWWCRVLKDTNGNATGALSTARDITDHKTMEAQLRQAQKMESVGRLAGGVAHDFNNMLMVIIGYTEIVIGQVDPGQPIFKDLQEILNAAKRSAALTRQLLAFARKQTISPVVLDINDTIASMLKLLRQLIGEDIDLSWQPGLETWQVKMDPSQIDQILANLLVNAKDAIGGVGSVTIETGNVEFDDAYCARNMGFVPGKYVMIAVSDTGAGMDRQTLDHLFEPFFTTKEMGKGTGLGLATVYGIVKQNNGFINVYSEPGDGTTFKIYLPRTDDGLTEIPLAKAGKNLRGTETVMIVEDEESILKLGASILKQYGYTVISAKSPDDALALAKQVDGEIHLLVTDVVMPKMHGKELLEKLRDTRPGIKSIFMSGYTANAIAHHGVLDGGVQFLQKPFSVKALAGKVREVLDGGGGKMLNAE